MGMREILEDRERQHTESFEITPSRNRLKMISFIMRDGSIHCGNYAYLHGLSGNDSLIQMDFTRRMAVIKGVNLSRVYRGLSDHKISFLREIDPEIHLPADAVRIDRISILQGRRSEDPENSPANLAPVAKSPKDVNRPNAFLSSRIPSTAEVIHQYQP